MLALDSNITAMRRRKAEISPLIHIYRESLMLFAYEFSLSFFLVHILNSRESPNPSVPKNPFFAIVDMTPFHPEEEEEEEGKKKRKESSTLRIVAILSPV